MAAARKKFFYKIVKSTSRTYGGRNQTADVYQLKYSDLKKIGSVKWQTSGYKGAESEVYGYLRRKSLVPVGTYKKAGGYWNFRNKDVSIKEI
tara:strand:+ start:1408 stop:1683 length:276 start_codon:yes stop_codon:yes gene_type:complete